MIIADEWPQMHVLGSALATMGPMVVHGADPTHVPADLAPYDAVVMYIHQVMEPSVEQALIRYTLQGGRLVVLHHGLASGKIHNPDWMKFTGMHIAPKDAPQNAWRVVGQVTHTLVNLNPAHYITSHRITYSDTIEYQPSEALSSPGLYPSLALPNTEMFLNQHVTDGREKIILFGSHCIDPDTGQPIMQDRGGWCKPAGHGWICYLQPGHDEADFRHTTFVQIILNCITWTP